MTLIRILGMASILLFAVSANAGYFGAKITRILPGTASANMFDFDTDNPHFRNRGCNVFGLGRFQASDPIVVDRNYSAALAALTAQLPVTVWYNDSNPCQVDMIFVDRN